MNRFQDRREAGALLGEALAGYADRADLVVLGLPRGGVPVAYEVARELRAPLDVFVVRKLGAPGQEELAVGAVASGGAPVLNDAVVAALGLTDEEVAAIVERERREVERRERAYRSGREAPDLGGKVVVVVDDGLATGATMRAAVRALRELRPRRVVVAVPVAAEETCRELREDADEVVCPRTPTPFYAVGLWYDEFGQTGDDEVRELLRRAVA